MRRRDVIALIGSVALPLPARAQQQVPVIGFLRSTRREDSTELVAAFQRGLKQKGYVVGENVAIEYRWADGQFERLTALARELVDRPVTVIVSGGTNETRIAKAATTTIPIVFAVGDDPITGGHVASLNRPEGNVTGASFFSGAALAAKRLELLHRLVPNVATVAYLQNPKSLAAEPEMSAARKAAGVLGLEMLVLRAENEIDFETVFSSLFDKHVGALIVGADPLFLGRRDHLVALAAHYAIPTSYNLREYAASGGLMSYGASITDAYRVAGVYAGQLLKGAKPADLPILLPTKFELVLNLKTAKALSLEIPATMLALADEVIE